ncbi:hypothetical protein FQR65_LT18053 [Abscondita terminalis]|nr:hypothetical protein FQR65_LT18053 [Abscondita terminalis]
MEHCRPDILQACRAAMRDARADLDFIRPDADAFAAARPTPSTMPPAGPTGQWDALWREQDRDPQGNALMGDAVQHDCRQQPAAVQQPPRSRRRRDDVIVVETPDAVLVADRRRTQEVKNVVARLARDFSLVVQTQQRPDLPRLLQQMHAQQLPAHSAPPIPMMPHPSLAGAPPSSAASLLGLTGALGAHGQHPLSMLTSKPELHRSDDVKSNSVERGEVAGI